MARKSPSSRCDLATSSGSATHTSGSKKPRGRSGATAVALPAMAAGKLPVVDAAHLVELSEHVLGRYELGLVLGKSHSGIVFQAYDVKADQTVALKILRPDFGQIEAEMQAFRAS